MSSMDQHEYHEVTGDCVRCGIYRAYATPVTACGGSRIDPGTVEEKSAPIPVAVLYARRHDLAQNPGVLHEIEFSDGSYIRYQVGDATTPDAFHAEQEKFRNEVEVRARRAEEALARANAARVSLADRLDTA